LIDIAMLAAGQLKGEALAKFVSRSVELLWYWLCENK
jgi:hypothetical protein